MREWYSGLAVPISIVNRGMVFRLGRHYLNGLMGEWCTGLAVTISLV